MKKPRIYDMTFKSIYPLYVAKAEKKGRTKDEVDQIIFWLTGHDNQSLLNELENETTCEDFFNNVPQFNPNAVLIKGVICGYRVEEIEDKLMHKIRCLDKLVDELAKGKTMEKIWRK